MKTGDRVEFPNGAWGPGYRVLSGDRGVILGQSDPHSRATTEYFGLLFRVRLDDGGRVIEAHHLEIRTLNALDLLAEA